MGGGPGPERERAGMGGGLVRRCLLWDIGLWCGEPHCADVGRVSRVAWGLVGRLQFSPLPRVERYWILLDGWSDRGGFRCARAG
jgi:hypothetical protein